MERVYSFSPGARMQPSEEKTIKQTHLSKSRYGMKCETSACIFSRSPNARNGMRRIKACRTVALARTNGLLIRSSSIINWSLSPHSFENSCTMTAISSHPSWAWWKDCGSLPPLSIFWISSTSLTVLGDLVVVWHCLRNHVHFLHYITLYYITVGSMVSVICGLTAGDRDQLQNPTPVSSMGLPLVTHHQNLNWCEMSRPNSTFISTPCSGKKEEPLYFSVYSIKVFKILLSLANHLLSYHLIQPHSSGSLLLKYVNTLPREWMPFLSPNRQCQSTGQNRQHLNNWILVQRLKDQHLYKTE